MTTRRGLLPILLGSCVLIQVAVGRTALAQRGAPLPVRGVVFDSLRGRPLANAFVTIAGKRLSSATDSRGRFRFDSVSPGTYTVTAQHPVLDSIGLSGLTAKATVEGDGSEVRLAVPSFETLWRLSCPGRAPRDSGMVFGSIRSAAGGAPVPDATVELSWTDLVLGKRHDVVQRQWRIETRTNDRGGYAVCGVPPRVGLSVRAIADSNASGLVDVAPNGMRVQRRDLLIGPASAKRPDQQGTIVGLVTDPNGQSVAGARVQVEDLPEVRTGLEGQFRLTGVPAGTRQIEVIAIGVAPATMAADVIPGDSTVIDVRLQKVLTLDAMRTMAERGNRVFAAEFDARRRSGFGYSRDSIQIAKYTQFLNVFRDVPSLNVRYASSTLTITVPDGKGGSCMPEVLIDGASAAFGHLIDLQPDEVGGVEVYPHASQIPPRFVPPGIRPECGMILVWTKYGFRNR
jgi:Carboxypeptidase regulatory-like domain